MLKKPEKDISGEKFIELEFNFGVSNSYAESKVKALFDEFEAIRFKEQELVARTNQIFKEVPREWKPAEKRSKPFKITTQKEFTNLIPNKKGGRNIVLNKEKNKSLFSIVPSSFYSPIELAKDLPFITEFKNKLIQYFEDTPKYVYLLKRDKELYLVEKIGALELTYPLKKRIELYSTNRVLDDFIFAWDLKEELEDSGEAEEGLKNEAVKMLEFINSQSNNSSPTREKEPLDFLKIVGTIIIIIFLIWLIGRLF